MTISTFKKTHSTIFKFPFGNSEIISLIPNPLKKVSLSSGLTKITTNLIIESIFVYAQINSLKYSDLPDFNLEDSDTTKALKAVNLQRQSERFELNLSMKQDNGNWIDIHTMALLNTAGFPYRIYDLLRDMQSSFIQLNPSNNIGISVNNVGYGLLSEDDNVSVRCSFYEEYIIYSNEQSIININGNMNNDNNNNTTNWDNLTQDQWINLSSNQWLNI